MTPSTVLLVNAYAYAASAHTAQRRGGRGEAPYINHPCDVAELVTIATNDIETIIAAVLHDVIEDTDTTEQDLSQRFGTRISSIVVELTDTPDLEAMPVSQRKAAQAEKMANASQAARTIKLADQISNLTDWRTALPEWTAKKSSDYLEGARLIGKVCRGITPILDDKFETAASEMDLALKSEIA